MAETSIEAKEYQQFMALREQIKQGIQDAESEFMLITYRQLLSVINKRQNAANKLNILLENKQVREIAKHKKEALTKERDNS